MLKWLFRRKIRRDEALEGYLARFDVSELSFLNDLSITSIFMCVQERREDPFPSVNLATYIHSALSCSRDLIRNRPPDLAAARMQLRIVLAKATRELTRNPEFSTYMRLFSRFRTGVEPTDPNQADRLGQHLTMLERIYTDPRHACLLPGLEAYDEASGWERYWRR
jgi:hypothetical protein